MDEKLYQRIKQLPKENIINLMWGALDIMQGYNGRSRTQCIATALGGEVSGDGSTISLVTLKDAKENTEQMGV